MFDFNPFRKTNIFDVIDFVNEVSSDPQIDGKKKGYERAAREYEAIYVDLKREYEQAIAEIKKTKERYDNESQEALYVLKKLEKERDALRRDAERTARHYGISGNIMDSSWSASGVMQNYDYAGYAMRFITDRRKRERAEAEKAGYAEAKELYQKKFQSLKDKLKREKENAGRAIQEYVDLISDTMEEIRETKMQIADIKMVLGESE